jgi:regulatory protein YycI of two-component signal transduction system YycFG
VDWSRAKTTFILTFLLLNIFLGYQLNEKREASKISLILEATLQERLSEMNITIVADLHEEELSWTYISGSPDISIDTLIAEKMVTQQIEAVNDETVVVILKNPYSLNQVDRSIKSQAEMFVLENIIYGDEFRFSHYDESLKQIYFYQTFEGKKVDNYESGHLPLMLQLDKDLKIIHYEQDYLVFQPLQPPGREQQIFASTKAIEKLFNEQLIPSDSEINKVELSYFSFFKPHGEVQVFAPMWNIKVNDQMYYVNAIDGAIQNIQ